MPNLNSDDFALFDECARKHTWTTRYQAYRLSPYLALHQSIRQALLERDAGVARSHLIGLAKSPGLDVDAPRLYDSVIHHATLAETLAQYLLSALPALETVGEISAPWGTFSPQSLLLPDGRLWRLVLVDRWSTAREQAELLSWRTAADCALTNRPILLSAIVIGGTRDGYRPSRWTQGYEHPRNSTLRILKRDGEEFGAQWKRVYREHTSLSALDWLAAMQSDRAFDGIVFSAAAAPDPSLIPYLSAMAGEIGSIRPTRSACLKFRPCPFLSACAQGKTPSQVGWVEKVGLAPSDRGMLAVTLN